MPEPLESRHASALRSGALYLAFLASGAAALSFETLFFHQAGLAFGNGVWASSLTLSAFMAGMALGQGLGARLGDRVRRPVRLFALLELWIAGSGVVLVFLLPAAVTWLAPLSEQLRDRPLLLNALRLGIAFAMLLCPTAAMGMSLPLLTRTLAPHGRGFGRTLGLLYGANTLGAMLGAVATEALCLERFGVRGSALCAGSLELCAAGIAMLAARGLEDGLRTPAATGQRAEGSAATARTTAARLLLAAMISGLALLALEVCWLRGCLLFLNDTPFAFALVLAAILAGIGLGSLLAAALASRMPDAERLAPLFACAAGLLGLGAYRAYPWVVTHWFAPDQTGYTVLALSAPLVFPTSLASGALFTLLGAALRRVTDASDGDSAAAGRLSLANTIGAAVGPGLAGFVLLPHWQLEPTLLALFGLYAAIALLVPATASRGHPRLRYALPAALLAALVGSGLTGGTQRFARASASRWMSAGDTIAEIREGVTGTHVHIEHRRSGALVFDQLATNAYSMSVNDFAARRYMELFALLPQCLHPKLERALVIGYGIGNTAHALLRSRELVQLDVADTSPEIIALGRGIHPGATRGPLDDPRTRVRIEDGRHLLAARSARYDLITGEPPPPIVAGVANLYSREYFALVRDSLAEGGLASYWLPMMNLSATAGKSIIHAFCDAFDDCSLWHGSARNFMLLGTRAACGTESGDDFARPFTDGAARAELAAIGFEQAAQLGALFIGDASYLADLARDKPAQSDDWPRRVLAPGSREERDALLWQWRDTRAARARFRQSPLIARLFPVSVRIAAERQFENQRLINDLLFAGPTPARQVAVLDQVLTHTPLRFPVLLLLDSDPDLQRVLAAMPAQVAAQPAWRRERIAGLLAERAFGPALELVQASPEAAPALPGLRQYLQEMLRVGVEPAAP
jgi:spermidine synthase